MSCYSKITAAKTAAMLTLTLVLTGGVVNAQDDVTEQLLACDAITDLTQRLACFNAVVEDLKQNLAASEPESPEAPASTAEDAIAIDADAAAVAVSTVAVATATTPEEAAAPVPEAAPEPAASSPPAPTPVPDTPPAEPVAVAAAAAPVTVAAEIPEEPPTNTVAAQPETSSDPADNFGRDSMQTRDDEEEQAAEETVSSIGAMIVRTWQNYDGRFSVELDNGQIWRETQGSRVGKPKEGRSVEVFEGRFGGYRMRIEGIRRIAWVRRTK